MHKLMLVNIDGEGDLSGNIGVSLLADDTIRVGPFKYKFNGNFERLTISEDGTNFIDVEHTEISSGNDFYIIIPVGQIKKISKIKIRSSAKEISVNAYFYYNSNYQTMIYTPRNEWKEDYVPIEKIYDYNIGLTGNITGNNKYNADRTEYGIPNVEFNLTLIYLDKNKVEHRENMRIIFYRLKWKLKSFKSTNWKIHI